MAAREAFLDTSILYALIDRKDAHHGAAREAVERLLQNQRRLLTTDYIVTETVNLANARAGHHVGVRILDLMEQTSGVRIEWVGSLRFEAAKALYRRHTDHRYSFTDCTSFIVMRELKLSDALTTDRHFGEAGFRMLLP